MYAAIEYIFWSKRKTPFKKKWRHLAAKIELSKSITIIWWKACSQHKSRYRRAAIPRPKPYWRSWSCSNMVDFYKYLPREKLQKSQCSWCYYGQETRAIHGAINLLIYRLSMLHSTLMIKLLEIALFSHQVPSGTPNGARSSFYDSLINAVLQIETPESSSSSSIRLHRTLLALFSIEWSRFFVGRTSARWVSLI
jgi:hypothetical protein